MGIGAGGAHRPTRILSCGSAGADGSDEGLGARRRNRLCPAAGAAAGHPRQVGLQDRDVWENELGKKMEQELCQESAYSAVASDSDCFCSFPVLDLENRRLRESASESFDVWPVLRRGQLYYPVQLPACGKTGTDYLHLVRKFP